MAAGKLKGMMALFPDEYIVDLNATAAAKRCGYSEKTAYSQGQRLLKNVEIQAAIQTAMNARAERVKIDADWILQKLVDIVNADPLDILNDNLSMKPISEWPPAWRKILAGFDVREERAFEEGKSVPDGWLKKIKWPDKLKALELIGKHSEVQAFEETMKIKTEHPWIGPPPKTAEQWEAEHGETEH